MNNRRDNSPTYDYEELQRRHAEYKARKRQEMLKKEAGEAAEPIVEAQESLDFRPL